MALMVKDDGKKFTPTPTGPVQAVFSKVVDIGTHLNKISGKMQRQVVIIWELAHIMEDGRPFVASRRYTLSFNEKSNLRKDIESATGKTFSADAAKKGFDLEKLIGVQCTLNIIQKEKKEGGDKFSTIGSLMPALPNTTPLEIFNDSYPDWVKKLQDESQEEKDTPNSIKQGPTKGDDLDAIFGGNPEPDAE